MIKLFTNNNNKMTLNKIFNYNNSSNNNKKNLLMKIVNLFRKNLAYIII